MTAKTNEQKYRKLDEVSHVLLRSGMYIGSTKIDLYNRFSFIDDTKIDIKEINYTPALLKIFDEILVNSVDESKRKGSKLKTIKVNIDGDSISVWDDGGISTAKHKEYKEYIPEMIFSNMRAGSNFDDTEDRLVAGLNGLGSVLTNIFSKTFYVQTCDGKNMFQQTFSNNMGERTKPIIKPNKKNHTLITFKPDYERFGLKSLDTVHFNLIKKRVYDIAGCNPTLKVYFNDKLIDIKKFQDYTKYYIDDVIYEENKNWQIGIGLSENGFKQVSFVNSNETSDGGTHVDYILNQIITPIREYINKKYKTDIKPSEIKNHIFLFVNSTVINPSFSSQTKEKLITEVKNFGTEIQLTNKTIQSIIKSEIVNSIADWIERKKEADNNKEIRKLNSSLKNINDEKLLDAKSKFRDKCVLFITEGFSAGSAIRNFRNPQFQGAYMLKGKLTNVSKLKATDITKYDELVGLMSAIGLKLGYDPVNLRYGKIYICCDADTDGDAITAQIINFFNKYWSDLFRQRKVFRVLTPICVVKQGKNKQYFYTTKEFNEWSKKKDLKKYDIEYKKGLASLEDEEYEMMLSDTKTFMFTRDSKADENLKIWFDDDAEPRKKELLK